MKKLLGSVLFVIVMVVSITMGHSAVTVHGAGPGTYGGSSARAVLQDMTMDEKISQMIVPAFRTWHGPNVQDLSKVPGLAEALRKHQYGGIILFGSNIDNTDQLTKLVYDLQENNDKGSASNHIPYLTTVDEEGGIVLRFTMGTRMNGNMAIGATGNQARANAISTGKILGQEMTAMGFNTDFAPDVDVNNNPDNPVIGVRSFSDDPNKVAELGLAFGQGLHESGVIATYKHFPGHGDTGKDSHTELPSVEKTYDELNKNEWIPFRRAISSGAEMIMTAHITYPAIDEKRTFADGSTGWFPATMSNKIITDILRGDMGYHGVVITDALEMDAIAKGHFVEGAEGSLEYSVNIAKEVINSGVDMLLLPFDMNSSDKADKYDEYISGIAAMVKSGEIKEERINESVLRILTLKEKNGLLDYSSLPKDLNSMIAHAREVVGSDDHHSQEMDIAKQAITLLKNEDSTLPIAGTGSHTVILYRKEGENPIFKYAISKLQSEGVIDPDAYVTDLTEGKISGNENAQTSIVMDYYQGEKELHYTDSLKKAIQDADRVVAVDIMSGKGVISRTGIAWQGIHTALEDTRKAGGSFVLLSGSLPYDAARYQEADAILLSYLSTAFGIDPTERNAQTNNAGAYNANYIAAVEALFGKINPQGKTPVIIPSLVEKADGTIEFTDQILYPRGSGLSYQENVQPVIPSKAKSPAAKASPLLLAKMVSKGKNKLSLSWNQVSEADGYDIYLSQCGKSLKKIKTLKGSASKTCAKGGLRKRTAYKACVKAFTIENGKKKYILTSPLIHASTGGWNNRRANPRSLKLNKYKVKLKVGKSYKVKGRISSVKAGMKPLDHCNDLRFISNNKKVASVSRSGKIRAVGKGSCKIYVLTVNGIRKKVLVTVK